MQKKKGQQEELKLEHANKNTNTNSNTNTDKDTNRNTSTNTNTITKNDLKTILTKLDKCNKPCYIMGDFNIDLLKYNYCNFSTEFFNQFSSSGYTPLISKSTRIT